MKKSIRNRLAGLALALGLAVTGGTVAAVITEATPVTQAEEAQAYPTSFNYVANCPGTARYQQLVVRNPTSDIIIKVYGQDLYHPYRWLANVIASVSPPHVAITYVPIQYVDTVTYTLTHDTANVNWFYHVDCFY